MKTITISISKPCNEQWQNFTTTTYGGFCKSCNKGVIDFTHLSEDQILAFLKKKPEHACGRFHSSQLKSYSLSHISNVKPGFALLKAGFLGAMLLIFSRPTMASPAYQKPLVEIVQETAAINKTAAVLTDSIMARGVVVSGEDGTPMAGTYVVLKGSTKGTITDAEGRFTLSGLKEGDVLLFSFIGLKSQEYTIKKDLNENIQIQMEMDVVLMGELTVNEVYSPKTSAVKRLITKVKHLF